MIINYKNIDVYQDDVQILRNVDLTADKGDFVFITGKVGSGKSSLLATLYGELCPTKTKGTAEVLGFDMQHLKTKHISQLRKQMGIVFQSFELLHDRNVYQNLEFVLKATGWKKKDEIEDRIYEVLGKVEMHHKMDKYPHELSGGEQQRVAIARAFLNNPKLIVADEPTGNLDIDNSLNIVRILNEIRKEGTVVVMSTHNLQLIREIPSARVYVCAGHELTAVQNGMVDLGPSLFDDIEEDVEEEGTAD